jgi:hypothetical protein
MKQPDQGGLQREGLSLSWRGDVAAESQEILSESIEQGDWTGSHGGGGATRSQSLLPHTGISHTQGYTSSSKAGPHNLPKQCLCRIVLIQTATSVLWSLENLYINSSADGAGRPEYPGKGPTRKRLLILTIILEDCLAFKDKHGNAILLLRVCK